MLATYGIDRTNVFSTPLPLLPSGLTMALAPVHFAAASITLGEPSMVSLP